MEDLGLSYSVKTALCLVLRVREGMVSKLLFYRYVFLDNC